MKKYIEENSRYYLSTWGNTWTDKGWMTEKYILTEAEPLKELMNTDRRTSSTSNYKFFDTLEEAYKFAKEENNEK